MDTLEMRRKIFPAMAAKRSLFGAVDHEETKVFLKKQHESLDGQCRQRWNFDFATETPLSGGRFEWVAAGDGGIPTAPRTECTPSVMTSPKKTPKKQPRRVATQLVQAKTQQTSQRLPLAEKIITDNEYVVAYENASPVAKKASLKRKRSSTITGKFVFHKYLSKIE